MGLTREERPGDRTRTEQLRGRGRAGDSEEQGPGEEWFGKNEVSVTAVPGAQRANEDKMGRGRRVWQTKACRGRESRAGVVGSGVELAL